MCPMRPRKVGNLIDFRKMYADTKEQLAKLNAGHIDPRAGRGFVPAGKADGGDSQNRVR